jgi:electron transport complex protein RnfB
MGEECYRRLASHLDMLPGGFAPSETGAEMRLLQRLFTPQEANLAIHLTLDREEARTIATRAGLSVAETEQRLASMARKGLILSILPERGSTLYQAVPFVIGIYEFQVNNLSDGFLEDLADYWRTQKPRPRPRTIPQMRIIPVGQSIEPHLEALPYEWVNELVQAHDRLAVAPCICRRRAKMMGGGCDAPEESCLVFGEFADYYVQSDRGRFVSQSEVMSILARADAANLVLQPTNSREVSAICCCCGCCCGLLRGLQHHPSPAEVVASSFIATLEPEACEGCFACLERCQMQALAENGDRVRHDAGRCIGCGLCVSTCPTRALTLVRKPGSKQVQPPRTLDATWRIIAEAQAKMH